MAWYWILYWVGYPISFVIWAYALAEESAQKKSYLERLREKNSNTDFAQFDYHSSLWALALAPLFGSLLWPAMLVFLIFAAVIASIGWALDKVVGAMIQSAKGEAET